MGGSRVCCVQAGAVLHGDYSYILRFFLCVLCFVLCLLVVGGCAGRVRCGAGCAFVAVCSEISFFLSKLISWTG